MLTGANKVMETRDVTWEATLSTGAPSPRLPEMPEQGGTMDLEDVPEPGGTDDYESARRLHCRYWEGEFLINSERCLR